MADRDDDNNMQRCPYRPDDAQPRHPLVAFKHFVDDQFAALTRLTSLSFSDVKKTMQVARDQQIEHERDAHYRWTGREVTSDHDETIVQRMSEEDKNAAFDAAMMLVKESAKRNANISPTSIEALYSDNEFMAFEHDRYARPQLSFGGACYYMPETEDNLPSTASLFGRWPRPAPRFLSIDWFRSSTYSPINLESRTELARTMSPADWRMAFEDLLNASLSKPMQCQLSKGLRPPYTQIQNTIHGPGLDWMLSLYCRGILPLSPNLNAAVCIDDKLSLGILEGVRQHWSSLAGSWAPHTAEKEFAELVRAVASPPAPEFTNTTLPSYLEQDILPVLEAAAEHEKKFKDFLRRHRYDEDDFPTTDIEDFWRAIFGEDANAAAEMIIAWEGKGRMVEELINDEDIVEDYLYMDTAPELWPLCEALEKAHSELLFKQHATLLTVDKPSSNPYSWQTELIEAKCSEVRAACLKGELSSNQAAALCGALRAVRLSPEVGMAVQQVSQMYSLLRERQDAISSQEQHIEQRHNAIPPQSGAILSALTTTQTTRMPDGSVTTKVVLKKRFADGREETTESVQVDHAQQDSPATTPDASKKRGWFWS